MSLASALTCMCDTILTLVSFSLLHGIGYPLFFTWLTTAHALWELAFSTDLVVSSLLVLIESICWFQLQALCALLSSQRTRGTSPQRYSFHTVLRFFWSLLLAASAGWITTSGTHVPTFLCVTCVGGPGKLWSFSAFTAFRILAVKTLPAIFEDATSLLLCFPAFQKLAH